MAGLLKERKLDLRHRSVVIIAQHFCVPGEPGGLRPFRLAQSLVRLGFSVDVLAGKRDNCLYVKDPKARQNYGFSLERLDVDYNQGMSETQRIRSFLLFAIIAIPKVILKRPSHVYATSTPLTVGIPAVIAKLVLGSRMIFEVRDLWPEIPIALGFLRNSLLRLVAVLLARSLYWIADSVIVLNPRVSEFIFPHLRKNTPLHLIPNIADFGMFSLPQSVLSNEIDRIFNSHAVTLVYAGAFGRVNDTKYLVTLCEELISRDIDLAVIAVGEGSHFNKTFDLAKDKGVLDVNYYQLSGKKQSEIAAIMARAAAVLVTFEANPFLSMTGSNKFFDGMAATKPIIINYQGWHKDLIEQHGLGLHLHNRMISDDVNKLVSFIGDNLRSKPSGVAVKKIGEAYFSLEKFQEHVGLVFEEQRPKSLVSRGKTGNNYCSQPTCATFLP